MSKCLVLFVEGDTEVEFYKHVIANARKLRPKGMFDTFPDATKIYINCDNGGSNGSRIRLWKYELQQLANITGLEINVSHFPPGASKWNKIEHRLFCYISKNWQGKPLIDIETVVQLISSTTTEKGLKVVC